MQPTTYTPTQSPTPTYGQSGPTVQALQLQLNQQNQGKPGYTPLVVDGKYGPLTQSATQFGKAPSSPFLSSTGARQEYNSMATQLDNLGATEDPYNQLFEQMKKSTANTESTAISNAQATKERETVQLNQNKDEYMAGLATAGVMSGANRYLPEYQAGIMEQARQGYLSKYQALDNAERIAIAQAKSAKLDGDIKVMKESLDYIAKIKKEKADAISEANKMEWEKEKFKQTMSLNWAQENRIAKKASIGDGTDANGDGVVDKVATQKINPTKHQLRRFSLLGVSEPVLNAISDLVDQGYTVDEAYAQLPKEIQATVSQKALKVINNSVTDISKGARTPGTVVSPNTKETVTQTVTPTKDTVTETVVTPAPTKNPTVPKTISKPEPITPIEYKKPSQILQETRDLFNKPLEISNTTSLAEAKAKMDERRKLQEENMKKSKEQLSKTWAKLKADAKKAEQERALKLEELRKQQEQKRKNELDNPITF